MHFVDEAKGNLTRSVRMVGWVNENEESVCNGIVENTKRNLYEISSMDEGQCDEANAADNEDTEGEPCVQCSAADSATKPRLPKTPETAHAAR